MAKCDLHRARELIITIEAEQDKSAKTKHCCSSVASAFLSLKRKGIPLDPLFVSFFRGDYFWLSSSTCGKPALCITHASLHLSSPPRHMMLMGKKSVKQCWMFCHCNLRTVLYCSITNLQMKYLFELRK